MDLQDEALKLDDSILFPNSNNISSIRSKYQHYRRKTSLLFLSVSLLLLLSFLLSFFTGFSFLHSYTYYFSRFLLPYLILTFERKYTFLLCNGILIFLAGKSGLCGASCSLTSDAELDNEIHEKIMNVEEELLLLQPAAPVHHLCEEEAESSIGDEQLETEAKTAAVEEAVLRQAEPQVADLAEDRALDEEIENENEKSGSIIVGGEEDDTGSEGPASNTEELNKKIEEFIRKMKEELQLEAQLQQLIAA